MYKRGKHYGLFSRNVIYIDNIYSHYRANMNTLVVVGTSAAYFYSILSMILGNLIKGFEVTLFFETSVLLILFMLFGRLLENIAKGIVR